ncbi:MAG: hypothetical protein SCJ97_10530 [Bacillota bacterium]|nr:hypothetical protein [Bacillota bacterium]
MNRDFILFTSIGRVIPEGRQSLKNFLDYLYATGEKARQLSVIDGMEVEEIVGQIFGGESNMAELTAKLHG